MEVTVNNTEETERLAQQLAKKIPSNSVIALFGDLGSGKTTFTSYLVRSLGYGGRVQSPTFVIMRDYKINSQDKKYVIHHLDLYRLQSLDEILDVGFMDILQEESVKIIEWPELVEKVLPEHTIKIYFEYVSENERKINVQNIS